MGRRLLLLTENVEELKNELAGLEVGDKFKFGNYDGPITWRVLEKTQDTLFVISEDCLTSKPFDKGYRTNEWNECSLKLWLNTDFFNKAFSSEQKSVIEDTLYGEVFLLSIEEATKFFKNEKDRRCKCRDRSDAKWWWLRSPGWIETTAAVVNDGFIEELGYTIYYGDGGVRPCVKLKI